MARLVQYWEVLAVVQPEPRLGVHHRSVVVLLHLRQGIVLEVQPSLKIRAVRKIGLLLS